MVRAILILLLAGCIAAAWVWMRQEPPAPPPRPAPASDANSSVKESALPHHESIQHVEFTRSEWTDKMILEVVRMVRPKKVQASIETTRFGRVGFVIVEGEERIYEMDPDLLRQYQPIMKELGLSPATGIGTRVLSRYRSVSKTGMSFDEQKDRMVVIVAPFAEWSKVRLPKPNPTLMVKTENEQK